MEDRVWKKKLTVTEIGNTMWDSTIQTIPDFAKKKKLAKLLWSAILLTRPRPPLNSRKSPEIARIQKPTDPVTKGKRRQTSGCGYDIPQNASIFGVDVAICDPKAGFVGVTQWAWW